MAEKVLSAKAPALLVSAFCMGLVGSTHGAMAALYQFGFTQNKLMSGYYLTRFNVFASGACGLVCANETSCKSFAFQETNSACFLYDRVAESADNGTVAPKTRYYWTVRCPSELGYTLLSGVCYKVDGISRPWASARDHCASEGARLVVGNTAQKKAFLLRLPSRYYVLGASDAAVEGDWRWLDGTAVDLTQGWNPNQPDDWNNSDCLYMGTLYTLDDNTCTTSAIPICEHLV